MDVYSQVQYRLCEPWDEVLMDERGWLINHWGLGENGTTNLEACELKNHGLNSQQFTR
jgi:hypothetical protein